MVPTRTNFRFEQFCVVLVMDWLLLINLHSVLDKYSHAAQHIRCSRECKRFVCCFIPFLYIYISCLRENNVHAPSLFSNLCGEKRKGDSTSLFVRHQRKSNNDHMRLFRLFHSGYVFLNVFCLLYQADQDQGVSADGNGLFHSHVLCMLFDRRGCSVNG